MNFSYDRTISTPQKKNQSALAKISSSINRKMLSKVLDFLDRI